MTSETRTPLAFTVLATLIAAAISAGSALIATKLTLDANRSAQRQAITYEDRKNIYAKYVADAERINLPGRLAAVIGSLPVNTLAPTEQQIYRAFTTPANKKLLFTFNQVQSFQAHVTTLLRDRSTMLLFGDERTNRATLAVLHALNSVL